MQVRFRCVAHTHTHQLFRKYLRKRVRQHVIFPKKYISFQKVRLQHLACFCAHTFWATGFSAPAFANIYFEQKWRFASWCVFLRFFEVLRAQKLFCKCMRRRLRQHLISPKRYLSFQNVRFHNLAYFRAHTSFAKGFSGHAFTNAYFSEKWRFVSDSVFVVCFDVLHASFLPIFSVFVWENAFVNTVFFSCHVHVISTCAFSCVFQKFMGGSSPA